MYIIDIDDYLRISNRYIKLTCYARVPGVSGSAHYPRHSEDVVSRAAFGAPGPQVPIVTYCTYCYYSQQLSFTFFYSLFDKTFTENNMVNVEKA